MHHEHAMQREAGRPRIDVANAGQKERGHELPVRNTAAHLFHGHFGALLPRRALDQRDQWFNLAREFQNVGSNLRVGTAEQERRSQSAWNALQKIASSNRHRIPPE